MNKMPTGPTGNPFPPPPDLTGRQNRFKFTLFRFAAFILAIILLLAGLYLIDLTWQITPFSTEKTELSEFYLKKHYKFGNLKEKLLEMERDGLIQHAAVYLAFLKISGLDRKIRSGIYEFDTQMAPATIIKMLLNGKIKRIKLTIVEGFDLYDIARLLRSKELISSEKDFISWSKTDKAKRLVLDKWLQKYPAWRNKFFQLTDIEGFLYPDTYIVTLSSPVEELLKLAGNHFSKKILPVIQSKISSKEKPNPYQNPTYWLKIFTIASLIEKETSVPMERPLVSSVIHNRLAKQMKLRFDPTVIYTLKKLNLVEENLKDAKINIRQKHFYLKSPYNTYYTRKLPPNPISSFGLKSLESALAPAKTEYLFFVAKKKGSASSGHHFSTDYEQHKKYVEQLIRQ